MKLVLDDAEAWLYLELIRVAREVVNEPEGDIGKVKLGVVLDMLLESKKPSEEGS